MNIPLKLGILVMALSACGSGRDGAEGPQGPMGTMGTMGTMGEQGVPGTPGTPGTPGESVRPSAGAVIPRAGFAGRELDVVVTVDAFTLDAGTSLTFGAGVTVSAVTAASSTVLLAHLSIDAAAALGTRDVTISSGGTTVTGTGAFEVKPHLALRFVTGTPTQGGMFELDVTNTDAHDLETGFVFEGGLWTARELRASGTHFSGVVLVDPTAPASITPGVANMDVALNPTTRFRAAPLTVAPFTPPGFNLTAGVPIIISGQQLNTPLATRAYRLTVPGSGLVRLDPTVSGPPLSIAMSVLPTSGRFADAHTVSATGPLDVPLAAPGDLFVVVRDQDQTGFGAFNLTVSYLATAVTAEQATAHGTLMTAQTLTLTGGGALALVQGDLAANRERDCYGFAFSAAGSLRVVLGSEAELTVTGYDSAGPALGPASVVRPERVAGFFSSGLGAATHHACVESRAGLNYRPRGPYLLAVQRLP